MSLCALVLWSYVTLPIAHCHCTDRVGHIILTASASPASLQHTETATGLLILAIVVMGIGAGSIKANVSPMIAEQYTGKLRKETLPSGEVIIRDPAVTIQSIYLWFYGAINVGACCAISAAFIARDQGYWQSYLVPTCIFALVRVPLYSCLTHRSTRSSGPHSPNRWERQIHQDSAPWLYSSRGASFFCILQCARNLTSLHVDSACVQICTASCLLSESCTLLQEYPGARLLGTRQTKLLSKRPSTSSHYLGR